MKSQGAFESLMISSQGVSVSQIFILLLLGLVPIAMMSMTSYLKVSIVLSVLRNALGGGQIPSQAISGILALIITFFTMAPVFELCFNAFSKVESTGTSKSSSKKSNNTSELEENIAKLKAGGEPLLGFLRRNTNIKERIYFFQLDEKRTYAKPDASADSFVEGLVKESSANTPSNEDTTSTVLCSGVDSLELEACLEKHERITSLVLAFVMSELRTACTMGVYLFLPFLVIDLIIATVLTGLGMMMVSPVTISLPIKLLLFVLSDGWRILTESLVLGYVLPVSGAS